MNCRRRGPVHPGSRVALVRRAGPVEAALHLAPWTLDLGPWTLELLVLVS